MEGRGRAWEKADGEECDKEKVAVVLVPFPAQSHLNQLLNFSLLLASSSGSVSVHYVTTTTHSRQAKLRAQGWNPDDDDDGKLIHFHELELPTPRAPTPEYLSSVALLGEACQHLRQPMWQLFRQLSARFRRLVVVHDLLMSSLVRGSGSEHESFIFYPYSAMQLFLSTWQGIPADAKPLQLDPLDERLARVAPSLRDGVAPDVMRFVASQYRAMMKEPGPGGYIHNTCPGMEGKYLQLLGRLQQRPRPRFAVGPVHPHPNPNPHPCLEWLDRQEGGSVMLVCFGSSVSMSDEQVRELAAGLEESGHKFIWALRKPDKLDTFDGDEDGPGPGPGPLPEGYVERVGRGGRGMVVTDWIPQLEILAHPSTGGFMTACGWSSCTESLAAGVPMAAWPMHSDQPSHALLVVEVLGAGILVNRWEDHTALVPSAAIRDAVTALMAPASRRGADARERAQRLRHSLALSLSPGGASYSQLQSFIAHITRPVNKLTVSS